MNQKALFTGVFALVIAAVFIAVRSASGVKADKNPSVSSQDLAQGARNNRLSSDGEARTSKRQRTSQGKRSIAELTEEMANILSNTDALTRAKPWLNFVNTLDPGKFEEVADDFRAKRYNETNMRELGLLLCAWADFDPLSAVTYAAENTDRTFARDKVLATWAASDPNAAIQWAEKAFTGEGANFWMPGVIRGLSQENPGLATSLMVKMPYSKERADALAAVLPQIMLQGPEATQEWIDSLPDESLREGSLFRLKNQITRSDANTSKAY